MTSTVYRVMLLSIKNSIMVGPEKPAILDSYFEFVSSLQQGISITIIVTGICKLCVQTDIYGSGKTSKTLYIIIPGRNQV